MGRSGANRVAPVRRVCIYARTRVTNYADNAGGAQTSSPPSFSPSFFDVSTYILLSTLRRRREEKRKRREQCRYTR